MFSQQTEFALWKLGNGNIEAGLRRRADMARMKLIQEYEHLCAELDKVVAGNGHSQPQRFAAELSRRGVAVAYVADHPGAYFDPIVNHAAAVIAADKGLDPEENEFRVGICSAVNSAARPKVGLLRRDDDDRFWITPEGVEWLDRQTR